MFEKLKDPKYDLKLVISGLVVIILFGLLNSVIPPIFSLGFAFGGITFTLGALLSAGIAGFAGDIVMAMLKF